MGYISYTAIGSRTWIIYPGAAAEAHFGFVPGSPADSHPNAIYVELNLFTSGGAFERMGRNDGREDTPVTGLEGWRATVDEGDVLLFPSDHFHQPHNDADSLSFTIPFE